MKFINNPELKKHIHILNENETSELQANAFSSIAQAELLSMLTLVTYGFLLYATDFMTRVPLQAKLFFVLFGVYSSVGTYFSFVTIKKKIDYKKARRIVYTSMILHAVTWAVILTVFFILYGFSVETSIAFFIIIIHASSVLTQLESDLLFNNILLILYIPAPFLIYGVFFHDRPEISNILIIGSFLYIFAFSFIAKRNYKNYWERTINTAVLKKQTEEFKEMQQKLSHSNKLASIGQLAAGISHEVNNPLTIINGNVDLMQKQLFDLGYHNDEVKHSIAITKESITRISNILSSLKELSREHYSNIFININLHDVINNSLLMQEKTLLDIYGIKIVKKFNAINSNIAGDMSKLTYIFTNLIGNSKDALANRENPIIEISTHNKGDYIVVSIKDNGSGIKQENLNKLFTAFFTTKEFGKGLGLGLATVYSYIDSLEGKIYVQSEEDSGTEFNMEFPVNYF
ncbi:MAG: HAMP domain-containing histidine kinase [Oligoflexia bacterium]|nr:HAMP domain-containing histidine kinase [Oligoflexia bacterium]